jgi:hypothetical protein
MWENFIGRQIRRCNRNLFFTNLVLLLVIVAVGIGNWRYLSNWFRGTTPTDPAQIAKLRSADELARNFVSFDVQELGESGYQEIEQKNGVKQRVTADFLLAWVGDKLIVVKGKEGMKATHLEGALVELPRDVARGLHKDLPEEYKSQVLPFMLDTIDYRDNGWWMLGIGVPLAALAIWNLLKWSRRTSDFGSHPIVQQLGGEAAVLQYGQQLETEMTAGGEKFGAGTVTTSWVVVPSTYHTNIARLEDMAWVYKKITKHSVNFIPTGKTYEALLWTRGGKMISVSGKEPQVDQMLRTIASRCPWVVAGFSAELENAWTKDRAGFIAAVNARRGAAKGAAAGATTS